MTVHYWKCQRVKHGVRCGHSNVRLKQKCERCGGARPKRKPLAHRAVLETTTYAECVERYGEVCGICGKPPKPGTKLHRDHDHRTGELRGLLDFRCNSALRSYMTIEWLTAALKYLKRAAERGEA